MAGGVAHHTGHTPDCKVNGEVKSDSSGVNSVGTPHSTGSIASFEEKVSDIRMYDGVNSSRASYMW